MVYLPRTEGRTVATMIIAAVNDAKQAGVSLNPLKLSPIGSLGTRANIAKFTPEFHS